MRVSFTVASGSSRRHAIEDREMALHAKILNHNLLRVSKLRKLSHTTQAIERNFEKTSWQACRSDSGDSSAHDEGNDRGTSLSCLRPSWANGLDLAELLVLLPGQHQSSSLRHPPPQHKALMPLSLSGLETLLLSNSVDSSWQEEFGLQERLSAVIKPVSYTADDIFTQPADVFSHVDCSIPSHNFTPFVHSMPFMQLRREQCEQNRVNVTVLADIELDSENCETAVTSPLCSDKDSVFDESVDLGAVRVEHDDCSVCATDMKDSVLLSADKLTGAEPEGVMLYSYEPRQKEANTDPDDVPKGPNLDQLRRVEAFFLETLPLFFKSKLDYQVYHPDMVFENNFWGKNEVYQGLNQYATQMMKFRALTHLKYAHVHMEVISSACLVEESIVRVQWRIVGLSQFKALKFWKYTAWSYGKSFREDAEWIDGVSIFTVNKDGLVTKHRMDRMMPDEEQMVRKRPSLAARLAILTGLSAPKPGLTDFSSLFCRR